MKSLFTISIIVFFLLVTIVLSAYINDDELYISPNSRQAQVTKQFLINDFNNLNLSVDHKMRILDAAIVLVDEFSCQRDFIINSLNYDPSKELEIVKRDLRSMTNYRFHKKTRRIFNILRRVDAYFFIPSLLHRARVQLGFRIAEYYENGGDRPKYIRSSISIPGSVDEREFPRGSVLDTFDGQPFTVQALSWMRQYEPTNRWNLRAMAVDYFLNRDPEKHRLPLNPFARIGYIHPNGSRIVKRLPWLYTVPTHAISPSARDSDTTDRKNFHSPLLFSGRRSLDSSHVDDPVSLRASSHQVGEGRLERVSYSFKSDRLIGTSAELVQTRSGPMYCWRIGIIPLINRKEELELRTFLRSMKTKNLVIDLRDCRGGYIYSIRKIFELLAPDDAVVPPFPFSISTGNVMSEVAESKSNTGLRFFTMGMREARSNKQTMVSVGDQFKYGINILKVNPKRMKNAFSGNILIATSALTFGACESLAALIRDERLGEVAGIHGTTYGISSTPLSFEYLRSTFGPKSLGTDPLPLKTQIEVPAFRFERSNYFSGSTFTFNGIVSKYRYAVTKADVVNDNDDGFMNFLGNVFRDNN